MIYHINNEKKPIEMLLRNDVIEFMNELMPLSSVFPETLRIIKNVNLSSYVWKVIFEGENYQELSSKFNDW